MKRWCWYTVKNRMIKRYLRVRDERRLERHVYIIIDEGKETQTMLPCMGFRRARGVRFCEKEFQFRLGVFLLQPSLHHILDDRLCGCRLGVISMMLGHLWWLLALPSPSCCLMMTVICCVHPALPSWAVPLLVQPKKFRAEPLQISKL